MYVIRKFRAGDFTPDHGRAFNSLDKARIWHTRECTGVGYWKKQADGEPVPGYCFRQDYNIHNPDYPGHPLENDTWYVLWEDEPAYNEFGLVSP